MKCFAFVGFLLLVPFLIVAQPSGCKLRGVVVDSLSRLPIQYSSVVISNNLQSVVQGCITNEHGEFVINNVRDSVFIIRFSCVGYVSRSDTLRCMGQSVDLGVVALCPSVAGLNEVEVVAQRVIAKVVADKVDYEISGDNDSKTLTVLEMLRKIPMVVVDGKNNITVNGSSDFKVYKDGVPNAVLTRNPSKLLKNMPASSVEKIEIITSPGAKYEVEGIGGIINIVTQKASPIQEDRLSSSSHTTIGNNKWGQDFSVNYSYEKWDISASLLGEYEYQPHCPMSSVVEHHGSEVVRDSLWQDSRQRMPFAMIDLNIGYMVDTVSMIHLNMSGNYMGMRESGKLHYYYLGGKYGDGINLVTQTDSRFSECGYNIGADYQRRVGTHKKSSFNVAYQFSMNPINNRINHIYEDTVMAMQYDFNNIESSNKELGVLHSLMTDFEIYINKWLKTNIGARYTADLSHSTQYTQQLHIGAIYAESDVSYERFHAKAGLRYEYSWMQSPTANIHKNNGICAPSLSMKIDISENQQAGLAYNVRIRRPTIAELDPYIDSYDPIINSTGNPDLDMEKSQNISASYSFGINNVMLNAHISHIWTKNAIMDYTYIHNNKVYRSYGNIVNSQQTALNCYFVGNVFSSSKLLIRYTLTYVNLESSQLRASNRGWNLSSNVSWQQQLPWNLKLSAMMEYMTKEYTLQGWESGMALLTTTLSRSFFKERCLVVLTATTGLGNHGNIVWHSYNNTPTFISNSLYTMPSRMVTLSINYGLDKGEEEIAHVSKRKRGR